MPYHIDKNGRTLSVQRNSNIIFSFDWNASAKTLTLEGTYSLHTGTKAYGLALNETTGYLYVGGYSTSVYYYDVNNGFSEEGAITVAHNAIGVAVDAARGYVYTGSFSDTQLCRYNLNTNSYTTAAITQGDMILGIAVDRFSGFVYVTTGWSGNQQDQVVVVDNNLTVVQRTGDIGNPTAIVVPGKDISYNPLGLAKDDGLNDTAECVSANDNITYTISYDSQNTTDVTNVSITDTLPANITFVSCSDGCSISGNVLTWDLGTISAGATGDVELVAQVNSGVGAFPKSRNVFFLAVALFLQDIRINLWN